MSGGGSPLDCGDALSTDGRGVGEGASVRVGRRGSCPRSEKEGGGSCPGTHSDPFGVVIWPKVNNNNDFQHRFLAC